MQLRRAKRTPRASWPVMLLPQPQQNNRQHDPQGERKPDRPFVASGAERENHPQSHRRHQGNGHPHHQPAKQVGRITRGGFGRVILLDVDAVEAADQVIRISHAFAAVRVDRLIPAGGDVKNKQWRKETAEIQVNATNELHTSTNLASPAVFDWRKSRLPARIRCRQERHSATSGMKIFWPTLKLVSFSPGLLSRTSCSVVFLPCFLNSSLCALTMASRLLPSRTT